MLILTGTAELVVEYEGKKLSYVLENARYESVTYKNIFSDNIPIT
ncbi:MAG: hypothetical protein ACQEQM_04935 [Thermoplasmatota archaeon]